MKQLLFFYLLFFTVVGLSQTDPHNLEQYNFIHYNKNNIAMWGCKTQYQQLFLKLDSLVLGNETALNILHIGDSHIQADYFSGKVRHQFYDYFPGAEGGRGCIFPYDVAGTNNPTNYYTNKSGTWISCKNVSKNQVCDLGITGIVIMTYSENASLEFFQRSWEDYPVYKCDRFKVFHKQSVNSFSIKLETDAKVISTKKNELLGYTEFVLDSAVTAIKLRFVKTDSLQINAEFYGISMESTVPGISYSALGVNGADINDWLRCNLFEKHIKALNPDLVIVSLGTNDSYMKYFSEANFEANLKALIRKIRFSNSNVPILLTTPGDNYRNKRYLNYNTELAKNIILKVAQETDCAVWDLYSIMGGSNSVVLWEQNGLTARDKLHYARKGYEIQADLLFSAFMKAYDIHVDSIAKYSELPLISYPKPNNKNLKKQVK